MLSSYGTTRRTLPGSRIASAPSRAPKTAPCAIPPRCCSIARMRERVASRSQARAEDFGRGASAIGQYEWPERVDLRLSTTRQSTDNSSRMLAAPNSHAGVRWLNSHSATRRSVTTRRHFLSLAIGSSLASSRAWAKKSSQRPTVGILSPNSPVGTCGADQQGRTVCYFMAGMYALGYVDGRNVAFEYRFADEDYKRLPALAKQLGPVHTIAAHRR
jgi:hypothetical protein